jgi:hypothetical protein
MRRHRRWIEIVVRVSALLTAVAWALSAPQFGRIGAGLLLCAASVVSVRPVRPRRVWRPLLLVVYLVLAGTAAIILARALPFAGPVLLAWAGIASVPILVWALMHPAVRQTITGWRGASLVGLASRTAPR